MARTSNIPANETKPQKSVRLAKQRMPKALKTLAAIANLGGNSYEFSAAQKTKMLKDLEDQLATVKAAFEGKAAAATGDYQL
jgi:hypothetical protein